MRRKTAVSKTRFHLLCIFAAAALGCSDTGNSSDPVGVQEAEQTDQAALRSWTSAKIQYVSGNSQTGAASQPLPQPLAVRVVDWRGVAQGGVPVSFIVGSGGGTVTPARINTDAQGYARASWTLGTTGTQAATADAKASGNWSLRSATVAFNATLSSGTTPPPPPPPPTSGAPGAVTNVIVHDTTTSTVTLRWTAVSDGTGAGAKYTVRYGSPSISWAAGSATERTVAGVMPGQRLSFTYPGLAAGTNYQFQVISYRGTLNVDAVFGPQSNIAAARTSSTTTPPPAPTLAVGTASAAASNAQVSLSAPAATGGTSPYTYQWHGGTADPGVSPTAATALSGITGRTGTHTGLSNGTTYYYRLVVADQSGARVVSNVTSARPTAPPTGTGLYPNMPAGMSVIGSNDGSVRDANGRAFGISGFSGWYTDAARNPNAITVVNDATNPTGSGKAIRFRYDPAASYLSGQAEAPTLPGGPYKSMYIGMLQFHEQGWTRGHKNFYFGPAGSPTRYWLEWQSPGSTRVIPQGATPVLEDAASRRTVGAWHKVELLITAESTSGAGNGTVKVWVDGVLVGQNNAVRWGTATFGGMEWYAVINDIPSVQYQRIGGLMIAGSK